MKHNRAPARGICRICGIPIKVGKALCKGCREKTKPLEDTRLPVIVYIAPQTKPLHSPQDDDYWRNLEISENCNLM
jgi:hypothetical protein